MFEGKGRGKESPMERKGILKIEVCGILTWWKAAGAGGRFKWKHSRLSSTISLR